MVASTRGSFSGWMVGTGSEGEEQRRCNTQAAAFFRLTGRSFTLMLRSSHWQTPFKGLWKEMILIYSHYHLINPLLTVSIGFTSHSHHFSLCVSFLSSSLTYCLAPFCSSFHLKHNKCSGQEQTYPRPSCTKKPQKSQTSAAVSQTYPSSCPGWWRKSFSCWCRPFQ